MGRKKSTKDQLFSAACRVFADCGYQGASVEDIVKKAGATKPSLYYYYQSKEGLFRSLMDYSQDERLRLMMEVSESQSDLKAQLTGILEGFFDFARRHPDLMRICFSSAFAAPKEVPFRGECLKKASRNFEFLHSLIKKGLKQGRLSKKYDSRLLAASFYGQALFYTMAYALEHELKANSGTAKQLVELFLSGAGVKHFK